MRSIEDFWNEISIVPTSCRSEFLEQKVGFWRPAVAMLFWVFSWLFFKDSAFHDFTSFSSWTLLCLIVHGLCHTVNCTFVNICIQIVVSNIHNPVHLLQYCWPSVADVQPRPNGRRSTWRLRRQHFRVVGQTHGVSDGGMKEAELHNYKFLICRNKAGLKGYVPLRFSSALTLFENKSW